MNYVGDSVSGAPGNRRSALAEVLVPAVQGRAIYGVLRGKFLGPWFGQRPRLRRRLVLGNSKSRSPPPLLVGPGARLLYGLQGQASPASRASPSTIFPRLRWRPGRDMVTPMSVKGLFKKFLWRSVGVALDMSSHESSPNFP